MAFSAMEFSEALAGLVEASGRNVVRVEGRRHGASGTVWNSDGVVVTAHHVLERDEGITVGLPDGTSLPATVVGRDPGTDVAVLRVDAKGLAAPAWDDAAGLKVGHLTLALGRPGKSARASVSIVSALGEGFRTPAGGRLDRYVQTDGGLPHGFSGGVLLDMQGRAIGVNTSGLLRGASLAVPTTTVRRVVDELLAHGRVRKGYLGVGVYPVRLAAALEKSEGQRAGLLLVAVEPGSPAEQGGLLQGDVLLAIDGQAVERPGDLSALLEERSGKELTAKIARAGATREHKLTPRERE